MTDTFRFDYDAPVLRYGAGCVRELGDELGSQGCKRALVVCGSTVGSTPEVIEPVKQGAGDRLAGVFAQTTPDKRLDTAFDGAEAVGENDADALVSLGGGSSLDVAKAIAVVSASGKSREEIGREFDETGTVGVPAASELLPIFAVPTTLAGADLSMLAGITASPESGLVSEEKSGGIGHSGLMPSAVFYDSDLFATTPENVLTGSAMNGFNKGVETLYARNSTPVTDATAVRGLGLLKQGLLSFEESERNYSSLTEGIMLVQYGISRRDGTTLSILHAFGHGLKWAYGIQQGVAHAVVTPRVLEYVFDNSEARRGLLADALGIDTPDAVGIVDEVRRVRDTLELPARLRDVDGVSERRDPSQIARVILGDSLMSNAPPELEPTAEEIEEILHDVW